MTTAKKPAAKPATKQAAAENTGPLFCPSCAEKGHRTEIGLDGVCSTCKSYPRFGHDVGMFTAPVQ